MKVFSEEYEEEFIAHLRSLSACDEEFAKIELRAFNRGKDNLDEGDPNEDAEKCFLDYCEGMS